MINNVKNISKQLHAFQRETDKALRNIFGKYIKGSFLTEIKHLVLQSFCDLPNYYNLALNMEALVSNNMQPFDYDICRAIVGCHSSNIIFLEDSERVNLERNSKYKNELVENVIQNIRLRRYGSLHFRNIPLMQGEPFIAYNVPYDLFVLSMRIHELLRRREHCSPYATLYASISTKALAALSLLEDGLLDNCYPICRAIIELFLKLILFIDCPRLLENYNKFVEFEIFQSCCEQKYPNEFNELFDNRVSKTQTKKNDYLHYGWVDNISGYHSTVKKHPYSINGIIDFLSSVNNEECALYESLRYFYKMCHGYTHGNVFGSKYPLLHYFEISTILHWTVLNTYSLICQEFNVDTKIDTIDIIKKAQKDFDLLQSQYEKRTTEKFENHYKKYR